MISLLSVYMTESENWAEIKTGLTRNQKEWVRRAYEERWGEVFCWFPVFVSYVLDGEDDCDNAEIELHHIINQGWCKNQLNINPDQGWNVIPLCSQHHRLGDPSKPMVRAVQECVHVDAANAQIKYRKGEKPSSYERLMDQRKRVMARGEKYWNDKWDEFMASVARDVFENYVENHPGDPWPVRTRK